MGTKLRINLSGAGITLPAGTDFTLEFDGGVVQARNPFDPTNNFIIRQYTSENLPTLHNLASTMSATAGFTGELDRIAGFLSDKNSVATFTVDGDDFEFDRSFQSSPSASASIDTAGGDYNYTRALQSSVESTSAINVIAKANYVLESTANSSASAQTLLDPYANTVEWVFERAGGFNGNTLYPFATHINFGRDVSDTSIYPISIDWGDGQINTITTKTQLQAGHTYTTTNSPITVKFTFSDTPLELGGHSWSGEIDKATFKSTNFDIRPRKFTSLTFVPYADKFDIDTANFFPTSVNSLTGAFRYGTGQIHTSNRNALNNIDFNSLNTSRVIDFSSCFQDQENFNRPLNSWDTSKATNMSNMFNGCYKFNQSLSNWDVSNVVDMNNMFRNCFDLHTVSGISDYDSWDTANVQNMSNMFFNCTIAPEGMNSWDTSSLTNCSSMFQNVKVITRPAGRNYLGSWDASNITDCSNMFKDVGTLEYFETLYPLTLNMGLDQWSIASLQNCDGLFRGTSVSDSECDDVIIAWKDYVVANSGPTDVSALLMFPSSYSPSTAASTAINTLNTTYNWNITY